MNHEEAIRIMGAEQYLLNELSPELREQFEEHFFQCAECANDVRAGSLFIEQSKAIFASEPQTREPRTAASISRERGRFAWLRPAFAVPALAVLLAVIAYQNWPGMRTPQVLQALFVSIGSRGGNIPSIHARPQEGFLLRITLPPDRNSSAYSADIYAPDGNLQWSLSLPAAGENDSYFIHIPAGHYQEGIYTVAIRGRGIQGSSEMGRSTFELQVVK
jgi:hypothetical protein